MASLHVLNSRTGKRPEAAMLSVLCNGDVAAKLAAGGLDPRPHFEIVPGGADYPATVRIVNHAFAASLYRPTRRQRFRGWWHVHRWPLLWFAILFANLLALYVAVCLVMDGANALADWVSGVWR